MKNDDHKIDAVVVQFAVEGPLTEIELPITTDFIKIPLSDPLPPPSPSHRPGRRPCPCPLVATFVDLSLWPPPPSTSPFRRPIFWKKKNQSLLFFPYNFVCISRFPKSEIVDVLWNYNFWMISLFQFIKINCRHFKIFRNLWPLLRRDPLGCVFFGAKKISFILSIFWFHKIMTPLLMLRKGVHQMQLLLERENSWNEPWKQRLLHLMPHLGPALGMI